MNAGGFVAFAGVAPVEDVHTAVGAVTQVDAAEPAVAEEQAVVAMFADVAGAAALEYFLICAATEVVQHVQFAAIRVGPVVAHYSLLRYSDQEYPVYTSSSQSWGFGT